MREPQSFHNGRVLLHAGDCFAVLDTLADDSVDSVVCDPPYALVSIGKRFGKDGSAPVKPGSIYARASAGFMNKKWDTGEVAFNPDFWAKVLRVLKPGGHLVAFSGTRTYHRMAVAIEDAGFEVRDMAQWLYGSGFPKSHDVSKAIDKHLGAERTKIRVDASLVRNPKATGAGRDGMEGATRPWIKEAIARGYHEAASDEAASWQGWGTALKPANEPICIARKPLSEKTVASNILAYGTGGLNIDACRVEWAGIEDAAAAAAVAVGFSESRKNGTARQSNSIGKESRGGENNYDPDKLRGRWPANLIHDGSDEVLAGFPDSDGAQGNVTGSEPSNCHSGVYSGPRDRLAFATRNDSGSAARFFYSAKADSDDRIGSKHPTVKPVDLMRWLARLVTPPGGTILDPFAGTGTTAHAALLEGFKAIIIEREEEYRLDIARRMSLVFAGPDEKRNAIVKAKGQIEDAGPLFGGMNDAGGGQRSQRLVYGKFARDEPSARSDCGGD